MKVLLVSPVGAGEFYNGPGMTAYRTFSCGSKDVLEMDLLHYNHKQESAALFRDQFYFKRGLMGRLKLLIWLLFNIPRYEVIYGLSGGVQVTLPLLVAKLLRVPTVVKLVAHKSDLVVSESWKRFILIGCLKRWLLRQMDSVVAISNDIFEELLSYKFDCNSIERISNGVDVSRFFPVSEQKKASLRRDLELPVDKVIVLFVGALFERKQPALLFDVMSRVVGIEDFHVVFVGPPRDGGYSKALLGNIERVDWATHVNFTEKVEQYYAISDIFCLFSRKEGFSNALLEAMASGVPVITNNISGAADIVSDGVNGYFTPPSVEGIEELIVSLARDCNMRRRIGASGRASVEAEYSTLSVFNRYMRLFSRVSRGKSAKA